MTAFLLTNIAVWGALFACLFLSLLDGGQGGKGGHVFWIALSLLQIGWALWLLAKG